MSMSYLEQMNDALYDAIEEQGFCVTGATMQDSDMLIEIAQSTPLGEDWHETIWVKPENTVAEVTEAFHKFAEDFDYEEAAVPFIEARGTHGVPESITDLLEDARWKKDTLTELGNKLQEELGDCDEKFMKNAPEIMKE